MEKQGKNLTGRREVVIPHLLRHEKLYLAVYRYLTTRWFRYTVLFFIVGAIFSVICSSFESSAPYRLQLYSFCYLASFVFTVEYVLRIIAAPVQYRQYRAWRSRFRYLFSFYGLIDFVAVIPFLIIYLYRETIFVHLAVLAYILMIFKLIRYSRSFQLIGRVLQMVKDELITACTACGILLGFSGILMYYIEHEAQPEAFANIGDGFWWAVVTFTTVGYGDVYPVTALGRLLSGVICMVGIAMIAISTGLISSAFMSLIQEKKRKEEEEHKN